MLAVDVMRLLAFAGCSGVVDHRIVGDGGHRIVGDGGPDEKEREDKGCNAHGVVAWRRGSWKMVNSKTYKNTPPSFCAMAAEMQALQAAVDKMMSELDVTAVRKFQKKVRFGWATW